MGTDAEGKRVDIGRVGEVVGCRMAHMDAALDAGIVPVISPLAAELGDGAAAEHQCRSCGCGPGQGAAGGEAGVSIRCAGLMADPTKPESLIHSVNRKEAEAMIADGTISGGMIPKIRSAVDALNAGVRKVHFVDGRLPHALLLEIFTDGGIGTEVVR
jgi:acetylglutamate kinase